MNPVTLSPKRLFQQAHPKATSWWLNASKGDDCQLVLAFALAQWVQEQSPSVDQQAAVKQFTRHLLELANHDEPAGLPPAHTLHFDQPPPTATVSTAPRPRKRKR
jgi:hypothetical protein